MASSPSDKAKTNKLIKDLALQALAEQQQIEASFGAAMANLQLLAAAQKRAKRAKHAAAALAMPVDVPLGPDERLHAVATKWFITQASSGQGATYDPETRTLTVSNPAAALDQLAKSTSPSSKPKIAKLIAEHAGYGQ